MIRYLIVLSLCFTVFSGCRYSRGNIYLSTVPGDSLQYVISAHGSGVKLSEKVSDMKLQHAYKGNTCVIKYLSDSATLVEQKGVLLFNSYLPDMREDMLSKGYFGTFTSKQHITFVLVSYDDFNKFLRKGE